MSKDDQELFGSMVRIENKDLFVDVRRNNNGVFLKLSERSGNNRRFILIPASGIKKLQQVLEEAGAAAAAAKQATTATSNSEPAQVVSGPSTTIFVNDLSWSTDEEGLAAHFASAGQVVKAVIMRKPRRGKLISLGSGIVEFTSVADATKAIATLNGTELDGRNIRCREDRKAAAAETATTTVAGKVPAAARVAVPTQVYVSNLSWSTTSDDLASYFGRAGNVKNAEVKSSKSGRSFGHGTVEFVDAAAAASAIANLNKTELDGREIIVREFYGK